MSERAKDASEVPRTDICEDCDREITFELEAVEGRHELIHKARTADEGFNPVTAGTAKVRFSCACGSVTVEFGPGSATAWDFPDGWMWPDNFEDEEVSRLVE